MFVLETADVELAPRNGLEQGLVFLIEEVESAIAALIVDNCPGKFIEMLEFPCCSHPASK
jgi:hypothetical protein